MGVLAGIAVAVAALTWGVASAPAAHVSCGQTITADTTLDSDLVDCPGHGVVIGAAGVTLDLAGHTIDGAGPPSPTPDDEAGVFNPGGHADLEVANGRITGFLEGVHSKRSLRSHVHDLTIETRDRAITLWFADQARIDHNLIRDSVGILAFFAPVDTVIEHNTLVSTVLPLPFTGILLDGGGTSRVADNSVTGYSRGVEVRGQGFSTDDQDHIVERNRSSQNTEGILLGLRVFGSVVRDNESFDNSFYGIRLVDSDLNRIEDNSVHDNGQAGIRFEHFGFGAGSDRNVIEENIIRDNGRHGIWLFTDNDQNIVRANTVSASSENGILVESSNPGTTVEGNTVSGNGQQGIDVLAVTTTITANTAFENLDWGIRAVSGVTDGGGNRAWSNGQPAQCLNVTCGPGPPASLSLAPESATNTVGDSHCLAATVADPDGRRVPGATVHFTVTPTGVEGSETTGVDGTAEFCYDGPVAPTTDTIHAFADSDTDGSRDAEEPEATAAKAWIVPTSTTCKVTGNGSIDAANGDLAAFRLNARAHEDRPGRGTMSYLDEGPAERLRVRGRVIALTCSGSQAALFGSTAGSRSQHFRIDVRDGGSGEDTYRIRLAGGYDSGEAVLTDGEVRVR